MSERAAIFERVEKIKTETITVEDRVYEFAITEHVGTPIILINGAGGPIDGWMKLWRRLRDSHRLFCYNRPGMGLSSAPFSPQNGLQMVSELREILHTLDMKPPYLLVGHSLGGFIAQLFACHYPEEIKGIVMLEPSTVADVLSNKKRKQRKPRNNENPYNEIFHVEETVEQIQSCPPFPAVPLTVLAGTHPVAKHFMPTKVIFNRLENLRTASRLSPLGKLVIAHHSGHFPQLSDAKIVATAIEEVLCASSISPI